MITQRSRNLVLSVLAAILALGALRGCPIGGSGDDSIADSTLGPGSSCATTAFPPTSATFTVLVVNDNDSTTVTDDEVYLLLTGNPLSGVSSNIASLNLDLGNPSSNVQGTRLSSLTQVGTMASPYTGKCRKVYAFTLSQITGGRLMVSYKTPITYYSTGSPTNTSENYRWDKLELAYQGGNAAAGSDLTSLDFFGIPMQIDFLDGNGQSSASATFYTSTPTLVNTLYNLNSSTMSDSFQQTGFTPPGSGIGGLGWNPSTDPSLATFARVLAPQSLTAVNHGYPAPYPSFKAYLDSLVSSGQSITVSGANGVSGHNPTGYSYSGTLSGSSTAGYQVTFTGTLTTSGTNPNTGGAYGPPFGQCTATTQELLVYSTTPTVTVSLPATGSVTQVNLGQGGSGYSVPPTVTFSPAPPGGTTAQGTAAISPAGSVTGVTITNSGTGYTSSPTITFSAPPSGTTAQASTTINSFDDYIYSASASSFTVSNITSPTVSQYPDQCTKNSVFANIAGDFIAGLNFGYLQNQNSGTAKYPAGTWYTDLPIPYPFGGATTVNAGYYNPYAAVLYNLSDAYGFAYSDRGGRPSPLIGLPPGQATMRVMLLNDHRLDAPQATVTSVTSASMTLSWPAVTGASGYTVTVNPPYPGSVTVNATSPHTIAGLTPGTTYTISVVANGVASGVNVQSAVIPVYATTTGSVTPLTGPIPFQTALNWGVSQLSPAALTFQIDGQSYTPGGPNVMVNGNAGTNVYPLKILDGTTPIFQGNYVVTLNGSASSYTVNPNGPFFLTQNSTAIVAQGTPPFSNSGTQLVVGTPFNPVATKQIFPVCFPVVAPNHC